MAPTDTFYKVEIEFVLSHFYFLWKHYLILRIHLANVFGQTQANACIRKV